VSRFAVAGRRLQFCAGPGSYYFYACDEHKADLTKPWQVNDLFFAVEKWPIEAVDPEEEQECDACREGG
jgi:hypothetical protein